MSRVSIIIPCYNDGKYLRQSVASARAQTHDDYEIIIVDDHSTDINTIKVLQELKDAGEQVLHTPKGKKGPAAARNWGIKHASGIYILPLDADDIIDPSYVAKAAAILDNRPEVGICYCKAKFFGLKRGKWHLPPYSFKELLLHNMIFISAMFRKKDWKQAEGFDESSCIGLEDHIFWLRLTSFGFDVYQIPEYLFEYRIKKNSRTSKQNNNFDAFTIAMQTFYKNKNIYKKNITLLYESCINLDIEKQNMEKLLSWKICKHFLSLEHAFRKNIKTFLGR